MNNNFSVTKNYSLTMSHIAKVVTLAQRFGISQGEVVRRAIDLLFEKMNGADGEQCETDGEKELEA